MSYPVSTRVFFARDFAQPPGHLRIVAAKRYGPGEPDSCYVLLCRDADCSAVIGYNLASGVFFFAQTFSVDSIAGERAEEAAFRQAVFCFNGRGSKSEEVIFVEDVATLEERGIIRASVDPAPWARRQLRAWAERIESAPTIAARIAEARGYIEDATDGPLTAYSFIARATALASGGVSYNVASEALSDSLRHFGWMTEEAFSDSIVTGS